MSRSGVGSTGAGFFMRLTGSNSTPLFFLEFHSRGDAHSRYAVADLSVLVGERLCFVRRGEERVCGLLGVVGRIPTVRLICCGRSLEAARPVQRGGVRCVPVDSDRVRRDCGGLVAVLAVTVHLHPFAGQIGRLRCFLLLGGGIGAGAVRCVSTAGCERQCQHEAGEY